MGEQSLLTVYEPLGVAALIAPLNFPIGMPARKVRLLTSPVGEKSLMTVHEPLGVAALIAPGNFPIVIPARKVRILTSPVSEKNLLSLPRKTLLKPAYTVTRRTVKFRYIHMMTPDDNGPRRENIFRMRAG